MVGDVGGRSDAISRSSHGPASGRLRAGMPPASRRRGGACMAAGHVAMAAGPLASSGMETLGQV